MSYRTIKNLKQAVHDILKENAATRNSDITLMIELWRKHFPERIKKGASGEEGVWLKDLYDLPREDNIKRVRAFWQNDKKLYLPTEWLVAKARGIQEDEWRVAMGYPTKATSGSSKPSWVPPSETCPSPRAQGGGHAFRDGESWSPNCLYCGAPKK